jgi:RNA polymerase sigma factor (sigma-70 family)
MYRFALNTAITTFKKNLRQPERSSLTPYDLQIADETNGVESEDNIRLLRTAVSRLTGIEKSIILLFLEEKSYEDIAEITGITQNYVRVKMNRIRNKLKIYMTNAED